MVPTRRAAPSPQHACGPRPPVARALAGAWGCAHSGRRWRGPCPGKPGGQGEAFATPGRPVAHHPQLLQESGPRVPFLWDRCDLETQPGSGQEGQGVWGLGAERPELDPLLPSPLAVAGQGPGRDGGNGACPSRRPPCVPSSKRSVRRAGGGAVPEGVSRSHPEASPDLWRGTCPGPVASKGREGPPSLPEGPGARGTAPAWGVSADFFLGPGSPGPRRLSLRPWTVRGFGGLLGRSQVCRGGCLGTGGSFLSGDTAGPPGAWGAVVSDHRGH